MNKSQIIGIHQLQNKPLSKILKRVNDDNDRRIFICAYEAGKYVVVLDMRSNTIKLQKSCTAEYNIQLGKIELTEQDTETYLRSKSSELYQMFKKYNKVSLICKTNVVKTYGKNAMTQKAFVDYVDNPYYKCSAPMQLFDENIIKYEMYHATSL